MQVTHEERQKLKALATELDKIRNFVLGMMAGGAEGLDVLESEVVHAYQMVVRMIYDTVEETDEKAASDQTE